MHRACCLCVSLFVWSRKGGGRRANLILFTVAPAHCGGDKAPTAGVQTVKARSGKAYHAPSDRHAASSTLIVGNKVPAANVIMARLSERFSRRVLTLSKNGVAMHDCPDWSLILWQAQQWPATLESAELLPVQAWSSAVRAVYHHPMDHRPRSIAQQGR